VEAVKMRERVELAITYAWGTILLGGSLAIVAFFVIGLILAAL
jgi:hypothetical protein